MNGIYEDRFKTREEAIAEVIRLEDIITEGSGDSAAAKVMRLRAQRNIFRIRWDGAKLLLTRFLSFMEACGHHPDTGSERDELRHQEQDIEQFLERAQEHTLPGDDKVADLSISAFEGTVKITNTVESAKRGGDSSQLILRHHDTAWNSVYKVGTKATVLLPRRPGMSEKNPVPFVAAITSVRVKEHMNGSPTRIYLAVDLTAEPKIAEAPPVDMTMADIEKALGKRVRIVKAK